jgi:hypothetical protein
MAPTSSTAVAIIPATAVRTDPRSRRARVNANRSPVASVELGTRPAMRSTIGDGRSAPIRRARSSAPAVQKSRAKTSATVAAARTGTFARGLGWGSSRRTKSVGNTGETATATVTPRTAPDRTGTAARAMDSPSRWPFVKPIASSREASSAERRAFRVRSWPSTTTAAAMPTAVSTQNPWAWPSTAVRTSGLTSCPGRRRRASPPGRVSSWARKSSRSVPGRSRTDMWVAAMPAPRSTSEDGITTSGVGSLIWTGPSAMPTSTASRVGPWGSSLRSASNPLRSAWSWVIVTSRNRSPTATSPPAAKLRVPTNSSGLAGSGSRPSTTWRPKARCDPAKTRASGAGDPSARESPPNTKVNGSTTATPGRAATSAVRGVPASCSTSPS